MLEIKVEGLDKAIAHINSLARRIKMADGKEIPVPEGMTPEQAAEEWLKQNEYLP